jgi:hypothetical protein
MIPEAVCDRLLDKPQLIGEVSMVQSKKSSNHHRIFRE